MARMVLSTAVFCGLVVSLPIGRVVAQPVRRQPRVVRSPVTGRAVFISMPDGGAILVTPTRVNAAARPLDLFIQYRSQFGIGDLVSQLRLDRVRVDALGHVHTEFRQVHRGVPVFGGTLKSHQNARGEFTAANGFFFPVPDKLDPVPTLDRTAAGGVAVSITNDANATVEEIELVVVDPGWYGDRPRGAQLAYYVRVVDPALGLAEGFFIDARQGAVLDRWNLVENLKDRVVHDAMGGNALPGPIARTEGQSPTGNGEVDRAYDYAGDMYDFYFRAFGRDAFDDAGSTIRLTVNSTLLNCPNAQWNGSQAIFCAGFTQDDIVAHELTHAVVQHTAGLIYQNQPGQLNESYADVFGELVDLFNGDSAFPGPPMGPPWPVGSSGPGLDGPNDLRTDACIGGVALDVIDPPGLAGSYVAGRATFGPQLDETGISGRLVMADPPNACPAGVTLSNAAEIAGNIAVINRGGCNFIPKTRSAQSAGAIGVLMVNDREGPPPNMGGTGPLVSIPAISITQFEGEPIEAALVAGGTVDVTMRANSTNGGVRWLLGESGSGDAIRDMWNPICLGSPDRANHPFQLCSATDNGGVHSGSGVPNHAFALVTDGGSFNGFDVEGIGPIKSAAVWYRALAFYLSITSDFQSAYAALIQSATDLVDTFPIDPRTGFSSNDVFTAHDAEQVELALRAVEMDTPGRCGAIDPILDPTPQEFCPSRDTIYQDDFEQGTADWTVMNTNPPTPYDWVQRSGLPMEMAGTAWFAEDRNIGNCQTINESAVHSLISPVIGLFEDSTAPTLAFTHFVATELGYDGGNLKISVNGGPFELVPPSSFTFNPYNSVIDPVSSDPLTGEPAFTGLGGNWGTSVVSLEGIAGPGDTIQFRFDFGKDGCLGYNGWYLSDIVVFVCRPAGTGDFDGNGHVDLSDYAAFDQCNGRSARGGGPCANGDLDGSGVVDIRDLALLAPALLGP